METRQNDYFRLVALVLLYSSVNYFTVDFKQPAVGINELRGTKGEHSVELDNSSSENDTVEDFTADIGYKMGSTLDSDMKTKLRCRKEGSQHNWRQIPEHVTNYKLIQNSQLIRGNSPLTSSIRYNNSTRIF